MSVFTLLVIHWKDAAGLRPFIIYDASGFVGVVKATWLLQVILAVVQLVDIESLVFRYRQMFRFGYGQLYAFKDIATISAAPAGEVCAEEFDRFVRAYHRGYFCCQHGLIIYCPVIEDDMLRR